VNDTSDQVETLLKEVRELTVKNLSQRRVQVQQECVLAGAIAAFLMPVYTSASLFSVQHTLIALAIVCFLLCILTGMWQLGIVLSREANDLGDMRISLEERDRERAQKYIARSNKRRKRRDDPDVVGFCVHALFIGAILFLVSALILGEYGS
jgi:hypothetical protein